MEDVKTIFMCRIPLPYSGIGSWTTLYNEYLNSNNHNVDYIICPESSQPSNKIIYHTITAVNLVDKLKNKFDSKSRFNSYFKALRNLINSDEKYIIHIIDHSGLIVPLHNFLSKNYNRDNFYIQYSYHGFSPLLDKKAAQPFFNAIDEMIFLTNTSYQQHKKYYTEFTTRSLTAHNAVNSKQFYKLSADEKAYKKTLLNISSEIVFIWCSQDRPKKGLNLILDVWKRIYTNNKKMTLLIVGVDRKIDIEGVNVIGRISNADLAVYYQISDFFLFPTLCKEGFGLVLAEALKCGCYCIASKQGGVPEVLGYGKYGKLVENPNYIEAWVTIINESIEEFLNNNSKNPYYKKSFDELYDLESWKKDMNDRLQQAKVNLVN